MLTMICNISMYFYSELFDHLFEVSSDFKTPCQVIKFDPNVIRTGWFQKIYAPPTAKISAIDRWGGGPSKECLQFV